MRLWLAKRLLPARYKAVRSPENWGEDGDLLYTAWIRRKDFDVGKLRTQLRGAESEIRRAIGAGK